MHVLLSQRQVYCQLLANYKLAGAKEEMKRRCIAMRPDAAADGAGGEAQHKCGHMYY